jgi:hypothetical protein
MADLTDPTKWRDDGDCYESAGKFITGFKGDEPHTVPHDAVLVHGRPTLQRPPHIKYGHAWIELTESRLAINTVTGREGVVPLAIYYEAGQIDPDECYRYTPAEARRMMLHYGHYGPWEGPEGVAPTEESA